MEDAAIIIQVLNDLIRVNNDRAAGYIRAAALAKKTDANLTVIFERMADESRQFVKQLTAEVTALGGKPAVGSTAAGVIYRAWLDLKEGFTGTDHTALLNACVAAEEAVQRAYSSALESGANLSLRKMIATQKSELNSSLDLVKKFRDMREVIL